MVLKFKQIFAGSRLSEGAPRTSSLFPKLNKEYLSLQEFGYISVKAGMHFLNITKICVHLVNPLKNYYCVIPVKATS